MPCSLFSPSPNPHRHTLMPLAGHHHRHQLDPQRHRPHQPSHQLARHHTPRPRTLLTPALPDPPTPSQGRPRRQAGQPGCSLPRACPPPGLPHRVLPGRQHLQGTVTCLVCACSGRHRTTGLSAAALLWLPGAALCLAWLTPQSDQLLFELLSASWLCACQLGSTCTCSFNAL
jgi:hypothetical protein